MTTARYILAIAILFLAGYIIAINWIGVIFTTLRKRRGIDRNFTMIPLMSIILSLIA